MAVHSLNPLEGGRWAAFVADHPAAGVFHSVAWLEALRRTYGFQPIAFTTTPSGRELADGLLVCRVASWLTGRRLVSVPFADHCDILAAPGARAELLQHVSALREPKYVEIRPRAPQPAPPGFGPSAAFRLHTLDLRPALAELFAGLHASSVQRKIRRAGREAVTCAEGRSRPSLKAFYRLMLLTRRRHGVPPQPFTWFTNLADCFGDRLSVWIAAKDGQPIAGILTLRQGRSLVYKYGSSDARFHPLGAMPLLFWEVIKDARSREIETLDLGRSDLDNPGLITFKDRLGARASDLTYFRSPAGAYRAPGAGSGLSKRIAAMLPDPLFAAVGRLLYPHVG